MGKTTTARVFAKALICFVAEGRRAVQCLCGMPEGGLRGRSLDIIEMDAASNTGVDHVREAIVEHVRLRRSPGPAKVYILDEAHMLSTSA